MRPKGLEISYRSTKWLITFKRTFTCIPLASDVRWRSQKKGNCFCLNCSLDLCNSSPCHGKQWRLQVRIQALELREKSTRSSSLHQQVEFFGRERLAFSAHVVGMISRFPTEGQCWQGWLYFSPGKSNFTTMSPSWKETRRLDWT